AEQRDHAADRPRRERRARAAGDVCDVARVEEDADADDRAHHDAGRVPQPEDAAEARLGRVNGSARRPARSGRGTRRAPDQLRPYGFVGGGSMMTVGSSFSPGVSSETTEYLYSPVRAPAFGFCLLLAAACFSSRPNGPGSSNTIENLCAFWPAQRTSSIANIV